MPEEYEVAVGDVITEYSGGRHSNEATVIKVGPKRVHVQAYSTVTQYAKETQQRCDGYPGYFKTTKQIEGDARAKAARELLRAHGVELTMRVDPLWTMEQLERLTEAVVAIRNPPELSE